MYFQKERVSNHYQFTLSWSLFPMLKKLIPPFNYEWEIGDHQKSSLVVPTFLAVAVLKFY